MVVGFTNSEDKVKYLKMFNIRDFPEHCKVGYKGVRNMTISIIKIISLSFHFIEFYYQRIKL